MASLEERLTGIAERISPCPPPDVMQGYDQGAHGNWPCATTEAAWLARGIERDDEMRKLRGHATGTVEHPAPDRQLGDLSRPEQGVLALELQILRKTRSWDLRSW